MFQLESGHQCYLWGKKGENSLVYKLKASSTGEILPKDKEYAELWMGTHVSLPSQIKQTKQLLSDFLKENPKKHLGKSLEISVFEDKLPFLFKILSIEKALSIQAHPNKALAEILNKNFPEIYKDNNYKPEMAIALTKFRALSNFLPLKEIIKNFEDFSSLRKIFSEETLKKIEFLFLNEKK